MRIVIVNRRLEIVILGVRLINNIEFREGNAVVENGEKYAKITKIEIYF